MHAKAPHGHWKTTTLLAAVRLDGSTAAMTVESATDTDVFRTYVRKVLCPRQRGGDLVGLDNLRPHQSAPTLALIQAAGAEALFLPAYSPDLNPIEKMWSKVKNSLRKTEARTLPALRRAVGRALRRVTAQDAAGWFTSCGYSLS